MKELYATIKEFPAVYASFGNVTVNGGAGTPGGYYIPNVSEDGVLSWTATEETMPPVPSANIAGPKGDDYVLTEEDKKEIAGMVPSGGVSFTTDETLYLENGVLGVNTATYVEGDNTLPITSAAVFETVGNIEILLKTI